MALEIDKIAGDMAAAALKVLQDKGPAVKDFAESEFKKLAETILTIEKSLVSKTINQDEARLLLDMQKNTARAVLAAAQGMTLLVAEQAINAALDVVKAAVNGALKFSLL